MEEIEELDTDSTDIFKRHMVDIYIGRSISQFKNGMYGIVDLICFTISVNFIMKTKVRMLVSQMS